MWFLFSCPWFCVFSCNTGQEKLPSDKKPRADPEQTMTMTMFQLSFMVRCFWMCYVFWSRVPLVLFLLLLVHMAASTFIGQVSPNCSAKTQEFVRVAVWCGGLDLKLEKVGRGREKQAKGSLKGSCWPPSITARVMAPEGPLWANHRPFSAEPPAGGGVTARCHAADSS